MKLYHCTTPKKLAKYKSTGAILKPVRAFNTLAGAQEWGRIAGRRLICIFDTDRFHKMPDHHNRHGEAWWADENISTYDVVDNPMKKAITDGLQRNKL